MLNSLSTKYQKEIALSLLTIFFTAGFASLKAQAMRSYNTPSEVGYHYSHENNQWGKTKGSYWSARHHDRSSYEGSGGNNQNDLVQTNPANSFAANNQLGSINETDKNVNSQVPQSKFSQSPDIGGPGQPEMSAFKPVGADNMVSPFTGDFSYNLPLFDVGGYPINMFYNSGITMDQEASWVGLGWNINPGTVNRNMRGIPDDFDGSDKITQRQSIRPDKTWGVSGGLGVKFAGFPIVSTGIDISLGLSFNNKLGVASEAGIHPSLSLSSKLGDGKTSGLTYGATVGAALNLSSRNGANLTPSINFDVTKRDGDVGTTASVGAGYTYSSRLGLEGMHLNAGLTKSDENVYEHHNGKKESASGSIDALNSSLSFAYPTVLPSIQNIYTRKSYNLSFGVGFEWYALNPHAQVAGYYSESTIADEDKITYHPAYGFLHYQDAEKDTKALLDFNRVNDGVYTPNSPSIALPLYTYDIFSITGEGTGGSFRAYRGDMGYMRDANVKTKDDAVSLGLDVGFGNTIHGGGEFSQAFSPTEVAAWKENNAAAGILKFRDNQGGYQAVYFKNPGEKTIPDADFQDAMGGENLVRFKMGNIRSGTPMLLPSIVKYDGNRNIIGEQQLTDAGTRKVKRDKRTQVITFLTAEEAARIGFDKKIYSYDPDTSKIIFSANCNKDGIESIDRTDPESFRKAHHISEIDVLGTEGRNYVYGLPVYNTRQVDVSFSIENGDTLTGKSSYQSGIDDAVNIEDHVGNTKGRDWYIKQEETPAYTHAFLLTELISPNYVDVTGNGISEDDMGDAVKFNYSNYNQGIKWRTPSEASSATYSEGLKTDPKDDKAHYIYGEREMWLLYSIESKNMVARFYAKNDRKDGKQVLGQAGGVDATWGMQRLDKICLYSKGDLVKYGNSAKPIKTARFFQSYKLCKGVSNSLEGLGKLTLDSIWIIYNGNSKKAKSRFIFSYPAGSNPDYEFNSNDRWGNYKPATANPANLQNSDYPYSVQDQVNADKYAAAWTMNKITLPSGGVINVDYESDDYAYVQNKKAADMNQIIGFGVTTNPNLNSININRLYNGEVDNDYVYVHLPIPLAVGTNAQKQRELTARYFENTDQLYMKLSVVMPSGRNIPGLAGSEVIPVYANIASFGLIDSSAGLVSSTIAWVRVKKVENGMTPMIQQALQFLKQQLPGKAYKGYDLSETSGMKAIVLALGGMIASYKELKVGDDGVLRSAGKCREVEISRSFARLTNPYLKKLGGGIRVKKITINDNWNKMSGEYEATYGQEYRYTTSELINNKLCTISSGVAAWEPSIGGDENPHKEIMRFQNHNVGGPYDFGAIDLPLGEAFYPTPMVGYSRVEVLSIHRDTVKNLPTRQVSEFYTTKDFPFKSSCTSLADPEANVKYEPSPILQLLHLNMQKAITQSQGFLVDMNDMNGKEKIQETYSAIDSITPVSYTQYYYNIEKATDKTYKFNHIFPTISSGEGKVSNSVMGRDIELMADFREHTSQTITTNIHVNFDFFVLGIFPVPIHNLLQPTIYEGTTYRSASLLKIVNHYGMLDSVVSVDKGSMTSTKNLVYDAETGNPLLTRTNNEHNKPVYNFSYPAHWAYSGIGAAYKNIDATFDNLNFSHGKLMNMPAELGDLLESGDELYTLAENNFPVEAVMPCDGSAGSDPWTTLSQNTEKKIWAVNTSKASAANHQWIFIDKDGNPYNAVRAMIRIVRSGHRNMLDQNVGSVTSMFNPVDNTGQLVFNDATHIIQTGAATFKDNWKVDNAFYVVDSVVKVDVPEQVHKISLSPVSTLNVLLYHCYQAGDRGNYASTISNQNYFIAEEYSYDHKARRSKHYLTSLAKYDLSALPGDATVVTAKLSLFSHYNDDLGADQILTHDFPPLECASNVITDMDGGGPNHRNSTPHKNGAFEGGNDNSFKFTRVTKDWTTVTNNNSGWRDYLTRSSYNGPEGPVAHEATPGSTSNVSYKLTDNRKYCSDERIDLSGIVGKMALNRSLPAIIKMELVRNNNYDLDDFAHTPETRVCFQPPTLDIYYYSCSDNLPPDEPTPCGLIFPQYYCTTYQHRLFCFSKFTQKKSINPYVEGLLGNWRVDTSYVYYGERNEVDPNSDVDTRIAGVITNYKNFWNFSNTAIGYLARNFSANDVWVWNSTITQYNRKGYEIENKDPLGRFNSGLYGYSQQLPIAIANNARVREVLFDGFEDYDYNTAQNCITCKPHRSFNYDKNVITNLDSTQHHTGLRSLKIDAGQNISINAPVTDSLTAVREFSLRVRTDSSQYADTVVNGHGTGLQGQYDQPAYTEFFKSYSHHSFTQLDPQINLNWQQRSPGNGMAADHFTVSWSGKIQPRYTGVYTFKTWSDDGISVTINGTTIITNSQPATYGVGAITLQAGNLYTISVNFNEKKRQAYASLFWQSSKQPLEIVPASQLYPPGHDADANGSVVINQSEWCTRLDSVNVRGNGLTDTFSLLQNKKMLLSAWVKEGGNDCKCNSYIKNNIVVSYSSGQSEPAMYPSGSIIEGWQRYESVFTVPGNVSSIKITLNNTTDNAPVYFDDIRVHPFNANIKTLVYHSSSLRLMSELDENNYADFYDYDDDGTLTRVKKETQQGIKTITETRS
ncbi:MAG: PA14 domain-containing protein, partial [Ginsengibacter sp.]